jgi:hypothetical protein
MAIALQAPVRLAESAPVAVEVPAEAPTAPVPTAESAPAAATEAP